jgi:glutathione S-transferase
MAAALLTFPRARPMMLIGQYDSPFVRRVGIALRLYEIPFEHKPWSTFGDADKIRPYNPLTRVPTLVLDDGEVLTDSHIILDYLDGLVPEERRMFPSREPARHGALKTAALATGLGDKAVSLFYERRLHKEVSETWVDRCRIQISAVLGVLEAERAKSLEEYWFGPRIGHADVAIVSVLRFLSEAHTGLIETAKFPALHAHAARLEALPVFKEISQPFIAPA